MHSPFQGKVFADDIAREMRADRISKERNGIRAIPVITPVMIFEDRIGSALRQLGEIETTNHVQKFLIKRIERKLRKTLILAEKLYNTIPDAENVYCRIVHLADTGDKEPHSTDGSLAELDRDCVHEKNHFCSEV